MQNTPRFAWMTLVLAGALAACAGTPEDGADRPDLGKSTLEASKAMGRAMKDGATAFGSGVGTAYRGIRQGFAEPDEETSFGPYPKDYVRLVKSHLIRVERYPDSTRFRIGRPQMGYMNKGILRGGGVAWSGWLVDVHVETVQGLTRHRAARDYVVRVRNHEVIEVHKDDSLLRRVKSQAPASARR